jgi:Ca-activated chloride channel family protein
MTLAWPLALLSLLAVPVVLGSYLWSRRRRRKAAFRYASVAVLRSAIPPGSRWRRHVAAALMLASLAALAVGASRPHMMRNVPVSGTTIVLAIDVSRSMCANDVLPNRLSVAQEAARNFVEEQPAALRIGLVVFSDFAQIAVSPTTDRGQLLTAIDGLTTGFATAIGAAMLKSLDALAEVNPDIAPVGETPIAGVAGDGFGSDIIVLLSDGANTRGIPPLEAANHAVERKIRVFTIGFGTTEPGRLLCRREQVGAGAFSDGSLQSGGIAFSSTGLHLLLDETALRAVADATGGAYHRAEDAGQLRDVLSLLPREVEVQRERREVTAVFAAVGFLLAIAALAMSSRYAASPS